MRGFMWEAIGSSRKEIVRKNRGKDYHKEAIEEDLRISIRKHHFARFPGKTSESFRKKGAIFLMFIHLIIFCYYC